MQALPIPPPLDDPYDVRIVPAAQLSAEAYHADRTAVSSSKLKAILVSPLHFQCRLIEPNEPTPSMRLGTAIHAALLEPDRFACEYVRIEKHDLRTKAGKAAREAFMRQHEGKTFISQDDLDAIERLRDAIARHPVAHALLTLPSAREESVFWTDPETGIRCKSRKDLRINIGDGMIVDLKKTVSAAAGAFAKQVVSLDYDLSAAMYVAGDTLAYGARPKFVWLALEDRSGALVLYEPDPEFIARGQRQFRAALSLLSECRASDRWPGYQDGTKLEVLAPPPWAC
jgi:hypothetical protein